MSATSSFSSVFFLFCIVLGCLRIGDTNTVFVLFNAQVLINAHPLGSKCQLRRFFSRQVDNQHIVKVRVREGILRIYHLCLM